MESWLTWTGARLPDQRHTRVLLLGVLVGALGGLSAGVLDRLIMWTGILALGTANPAADGPTVLRALIAPALTGLAAGFVVQRLSTRRAPQGIPEVIEGIRNDGGRVSARDAAVSSVAAALAVGGGQSAGREGPIVQLAAAVASAVTERLNVSPQTARALVAGGAAAGIAASFNTPLGGAFFAMEVLLGSFALDAFAPVVVASVTGTVVGQALLGERLALTLPPFHLSSPVELLLFPAVGVACGLVASVFRRVMGLTGRWIDGLPLDPVLKPALAGLVIGALAALGLPHVMGNGYRLMEQLITGEPLGLLMLLGVLVAKVCATSLSFGSKAGGGLFAPSLFLGAITGQLVGTAGQALFPSLGVQPGMMGMVGMGAVAGAIAQSPVTMTLMLFEMTGNYAVILPLLITVAIASVVANASDQLSIYLQALLDRGVRIDQSEDLVLYELHVVDVMREGGGHRVAADASFGVVAAVFLDQPSDELWVLEDGRVLGVIDIQHVKGMLGHADQSDATARSLARTTPTVLPSDALAVAMERFFESGQEAMPVVDGAGTMLGVLAERDVVGALNRELLRQDVLMARVHHGPAHDRHRDFFELPKGFSLAAVEAGTLAGSALVDLDLPRRLGVMVLAVDQYDEEHKRHDRVPAKASLVLGPRDRLVVMGPAAHLRALSRQDDAEVDVTVEATRADEE